MCIAVVGRVIQITPDGAEIEVGGRLRRACTLLLPDLRVGEHVLVSGGIVVDRLTPEEVRERSDMFDKLTEML